MQQLHNSTRKLWLITVFLLILGMTIVPLPSYAAHDAGLSPETQPLVAPSFGTPLDLAAYVGQINVGDTFSSAILTYGGYDDYGFTSTAGQQVAVSLVATSSTFDPYLALWYWNGAEWVLLLENDDSNGTLNAALNLTFNVSGEFIIRAQGFGWSVGSYSLSVDGDGGQSGTNTIAYGETRTGAVTRTGGSTDYVFNASAGDAIVATLIATDRRFDPFLEIYNSQMQLLDYNDDSNGTYNSQIAGAFAVSGQYILRARGYGSSTGSYQLALDLQGSSPEPTPNPPSDGFVVTRDGFRFTNFSYNGADWEQFKLTFPGTQMELPDGRRRNGPNIFFEERYRRIGEGGNCYGFMMASLVSYLNLPETTEQNLLSSTNRNFTTPYSLSAGGTSNVTPGQSDVKDYLHLYQARQLSSETRSWLSQQSANTPVQTFGAVEQSIQRGEPVGILIFDRGSGHAMTGYRTERSGNTGFIYIYDNNYPGNDSRRVIVNLSDNSWQYDLGGQVWGGRNSGLQYVPASYYAPASLPSDSLQSSLALAQAEPSASGQIYVSSASEEYTTSSLSLAQTESSEPGPTYLAVEGDAAVQIQDSEGNQLGFENDTFVNDIPGAFFLPLFEFNLSNPDAPARGFYVLPPDDSFTVGIEGTGNGSYDLFAFTDGSVLSVADINITGGVTDQLLLPEAQSSDESGGIRNATFQANVETDYELYLTHEQNESSLGFTTQVQGAGTATTLRLEPDGETIVVRNESTQEADVDLSVDDRIKASSFDTNGVFTFGDTTQQLGSCDDIWLTDIKVGGGWEEVPALAGEVDGNGIVELSDFSLLASSFGVGKSDVDFDACADFDDNGFVELSDFAALANNFGEVRTASVGQATRTTAAAIQPGAIARVQQVVQAGSLLDIQVLVRTDGSSVDAAQAAVNYDPALFEMISVTPGTLLTTEIAQRIDTQQGQIDLAYGSLEGAVTSDELVVATISLRARADASLSSISLVPYDARNFQRRSDVTAEGESVLGERAWLDLAVSQTAQNSRSQILLPFIVR